MFGPGDRKSFITMIITAKALILNCAWLLRPNDIQFVKIPLIESSLQASRCELLIKYFWTFKSKKGREDCNDIYLHRQPLNSGACTRVQQMSCELSEHQTLITHQNVLMKVIWKMAHGQVAGNIKLHSLCRFYEFRFIHFIPPFSIGQAACELIDTARPTLPNLLPTPIGVRLTKWKLNFLI